MVLVGDGTMTFSPRPPAERVQVRLFSGRETLDDALHDGVPAHEPVQRVVVRQQGRVHGTGRTPSPGCSRAPPSSSPRRCPAPSASTSSDLSRDTWSLIPGAGDLVADVRTRKYNVLTYARSNGEAEDITVFDRASRRNIAVYPSVAQDGGERRARVQRRPVGGLRRHRLPGRVLRTSRNAPGWRADALAPARACDRAGDAHAAARRAAGRPVGAVRRARAAAVAFRVRDQNNVLVSLPKPASRDDEITLTVSYGGRLEAQPPDREVAGVEAGQQLPVTDMPQIAPEPRWVLSNRSYWYPQNTVSDYARGVLRLSVPASTSVAASGDPSPSNPSCHAGGVTRRSRPPDVYVFDVRQPARYFAWLITKLVPAGKTEVVLPELVGRPDDWTGRHVRRRRRSRRPRPRHAAAAAGGPLPWHGGRRAWRTHGRSSTRRGPCCRRRARYSPSTARSWTTCRTPRYALCRARRRPAGRTQPGLHGARAPAAAHDRRSAGATTPSTSTSTPRFFLAHEVAHQFWGQAVGWKSYHEQWISEGFAQFFALLYAERQGGPGVARSVLSRLRSTAIAQSQARARSSWATGWDTSAATAACSGRWSTTRPRWCCTCCGG